MIIVNQFQLPETEEEFVLFSLSNSEDIYQRILDSFKKPSQEISDNECATITKWLINQEFVKFNVQPMLSSLSLDLGSANIRIRRSHTEYCYLLSGFAIEQIKEIFQ